MDIFRVNASSYIQLSAPSGLSRSVVKHFVLNSSFENASPLPDVSFHLENHGLLHAQL